MVKIINHISKIFYKKRIKPIYLIFNVTNICNSKCSTCFAWKYLNKNIEKELKINEIKKISISLKKIEWLLLTGGEPFLRKDLPEIIEIFYKQNKVRRATIPTNSILTKEIQSDIISILDKCPKLKLILSLSIDGVGKKHDSIRGFSGNFKQLEKTYKMLTKLKEKYPNLSINMNTCLNNKNISDIGELLRYCENNFPKIDFHGFELLRGIPKNSEFSTPTVKEYKTALKKIKNYWKKLKFYDIGFSKILKAAKILTRDIELDILSNARKTPCFAGSITGVISANGDVSLCELQPFIGNIRNYDYDFGKIWFNKKATEQRKKIRKRLGICRGCTHSCFISSAIIFNPILYPKLFIYTSKVFLEKFRRKK